MTRHEYPYIRCYIDEDGNDRPRPLSPAELKRLDDLKEACFPSFMRMVDAGIELGKLIEKERWGID